MGFFVVGKCFQQGYSFETNLLPKDFHEFQ